MKKQLFAIAVLIAAVAMSAIFTTCADPFAPDLTPERTVENDGALRTVAFTVVEAEGGMVTLEYVPPAKAARALSLPLAKAATDFYEVVFVDETAGAGSNAKVWRRNFREGQTVRMTVAYGEYDNGANSAGAHIAYMFAGRFDSKTLLAVGKISKVEYKEAGKYDDGTTNTYNPGDEGAFLINGDAKIVTFELEALENDVTGGEFGSFKTWDIANKAVSPNPETHPEANWDYVPGASVLAAKINNQVVPVFTIPKDVDTHGLINIWIGGGTSTSGEAIIVDDANIVIDSKGFFEQGLRAPMATVEIDFVHIESQAGGLTIDITMTPQSFVAPGGLGVFTYSIPVHNYNDNPSENNGAPAITWFVRGGISNHLYDTGPDNDSQGGKIVLGVGDLSNIKFIGAADEDGFYVSGGYPVPITYNVEEDGGINGPGGKDTTGIKFIFSKPVSGLTAAHITISNEAGVAEAELTTGDVTLEANSGGTVWILEVTEVTKPGYVYVSINKNGIERGRKLVGVIYEEDIPAPTVTVSAVYAQRGVLYSDTPNDNLKNTLMVKLLYDGASPQMLSRSEYSLSVASPLPAGEVTVTVNAQGFTNTFTVIIAARYTAAANNTENTTAITLTFDTSIDAVGLIAGDITVANATGAVTTGALSGSGNTWELAIDDVATAGNVSVSIDKKHPPQLALPYIETAAKTVAVYKSGPLIDMKLIPGGTFTMGQTGVTNATPEHQVTLSDFYLGTTEVTQAQWYAVMGTTIAQQQALTTIQGSFGEGDDYPMYYLNWYDALVFCNKLSMMENKSPAYRIRKPGASAGSTNPSDYSTDPADWGTVPSASDDRWNAAAIVGSSNGYRLPTEAQWEYAAKGGDPTAAGYVAYTYSGSDDADEVAWHTGNSGSTTHEVGGLAANGLGLYDMSGNVYEWCWNKFGDYQSVARTDPLDDYRGVSTTRVYRSGGWSLGASYALPAARGNQNASLRNTRTGLRVALPIEGGGQPAQSLYYELISGGANDGTYRVVGIGTLTDLDLYTVVIPATYNSVAVTEIGSASDAYNIGAFTYNASITRVSIPSSVTYIGPGAFNFCSGLSAITIPEGVTTIGNQAFSNCTSLTDITIPSTVTSIASSAFSVSTSLSTITINTYLTFTANNNNWGTIFSGSTNNALTVRFNANVGSYAFGYASANNRLASVTIAANVTAIGPWAFNNCNSLTSVTFEGTIPSANFNSGAGVFPGDLRAKFYATDSADGTPGTYTRTAGSTTWAKEP